MNFRGLAVVLASVGLCAACGVLPSAEQPDTRIKNTCGAETGCGSGICACGTADCARLICASTQGTLSELLVEVNPPLGTVAGVRFLKPLRGLPPGGGRIDIEAGLLATFYGALGFSSSDNCKPAFQLDPQRVGGPAADGSVPVQITLTPSEQAFGIAASGYVVKSTTTSLTTYPFSTRVPAGFYDLYIEPFPQAGTQCKISPLLIRKQKVEADNVKLAVKLPVSSELNLDIRGLLGVTDFSGWTAQMLDSVSGRAVSGKATLERSLATGRYGTKLLYNPVVAATSMDASEVVRFRPPESVTAPDVLIARQALELFNKGSGVVELAGSIPEAVNVEAQVTTETTAPAGTSIILVAKHIDGIDTGNLASFARKVDVDAGGKFNVTLLPGTYRVTAVPSGGTASFGAGLATRELTWEIGRAPFQAGKQVSLSPLNRLDGHIQTPLSGEGFRDVPVLASPSYSGSSVFENALGTAAFLPRVATANADLNGNFILSTDPGTFDISVRSDRNSDFAWAVFPRVKLNATMQQWANIDLNLPVIYTGLIRLPDVSESVEVGSALIRAYAYVNEKGEATSAETAHSVVQVGETRADENGYFSLLVPAKLNSPPANSSGPVELSGR